MRPRRSAARPFCAPSTRKRCADNPNKWEVYVHGGRTATGIDAVEWAAEAARRGAGEILLTSMDRDGSKDGFDCALTRAVARAVDIPVIASGGVGKLEHFAEGIIDGEADAVLAASVFHFGEFTVTPGQGVHALTRHSGAPVDCLLLVLRRVCSGVPFFCRLVIDCRRLTLPTTGPTMQAQLPELKYNADGLIPCIVQDVETREVLMMAWMNAESLAADARARRDGVLEPQPPRTVAQRCHQRKHAEDHRAALRLRRRHAACVCAPGRPRLPYRRHQLLLPHAEGVLVASAFAFRGGRAFACPPFLVLPQLVRIA